MVRKFHCSSVYAVYDSYNLGKRVFWHSSAHVLGESAEKHYGCHLCIGPPTDDGFFYEMAIEGRAVTNADYPVLEKLSEGAAKEKQKFERIVVPKEILLKMFGVSLVSSCTVKCGFSPWHFSTTNTRSISSRLRFLMELPPQFIVVAP